ncbi:hypothetical protein POM88_018021 [Heracleum sosnowskyi]|uniref:DNA topoisomerase n=1 Tax=Heracleum sosnowskyi TaxID=360622 RepID=A0AAD8IRH7_9APIA|nr:hypothetical protein POM88_018021 [Heracleum sosnowskyi]
MLWRRENCMILVPIHGKFLIPKAIHGSSLKSLAASSKRTAGCGTWDGKTKRTEIRDYDGNLIGERRMLVFEIKEVSHQEDLSRVGHWRMHEYSLCGINDEIPNLSNTVLCKITLEHSKEPAIELHSDGTTIKVDVKMDAVEQCYETDSVQTCDNDDVEQIYSIYDGCTCADDELVWYNSLFVRGEDGNYETDSVQTCDKDDVEEIHSIDDGCTCVDDNLDCFKLKHRMCYGPCQTPTLGFCVQRYLQINTFKPEKFWAVHPYIIHNGYELKLEWERNRLFDTDVAEMFGGLIVEDAPYPLTANLSVGGEFFNCTGQNVMVNGFTSLMPWLAISEKSLPRLTKGEKIELSKVELLKTWIHCLKHNSLHFRILDACLRYMKCISSLPSRLFCGTCEEVYYVPQKGTIKLYKEITCPLDNFELLIYSMAGPEGKS